MNPITPVTLMAAILIASPTPLPADNPKSNDQPTQPLELKLVAKRDTYTLDLAGKSPQHYRRLIQRAEKQNQEPPAAPGVDLFLEFHNSSEHPITIYVDGDDARLFLELKGPGAVSARYGQTITLEFRSSRAVTIAANNSYSRQIKSLEGGWRGEIQRWYWTQPGEYTLSARYQLGAPDGRKGPELTSNPIKLTIEAGSKNQ